MRPLCFYKPPNQQPNTDVQDIPLADESVDVVICNHILEHVADDRKAMCELHRILRRGGWGVVLVPQDLNREKTFEDDTITSPEALISIS